MSILVVGSTGTIGSHVVEELARRNTDVHALIHEKKPRLPAAVKAVPGDVTDMDSMRKALAGVTTLFLLNPVVADELNRALLCLDLALEAGINRVVYFSMFNADTFLDCPHACAKYATELMIKKMNIPATILRPNYFFQNDGPPIMERGVYPIPIGSLGVSMVDARDIAEVAALSLIEREKSAEPLPTRIVEIHGPDVVTSESAVALWSEVLGKNISYPGDDLQAAEKRLRAAMPSAMAYDQVGMFRGFHRYGMVGRAEAIERVTQMLGRPLRTYRQYATDVARGGHKEAFAG